MFKGPSLHAPRPRVSSKELVMLCLRWLCVQVFDFKKELEARKLKLDTSMVRHCEFALMFLLLW